MLLTTTGRKIHRIFAGRVPPQGKYPNKWERQNRDTQPAQLEEGSLVIPKQYVRMVENFLKKSGIILDNYRNHSISQPVDVLLVVNELIIPKKYVDRVVSFLKSNGIHLPNT